MLTLPFSPVAYAVVSGALLVVDGLGLDGNPLARVALAAVVLVLFAGLAVADVAVARAAWDASRRRRQRRVPAPTR